MAVAGSTLGMMRLALWGKDRTGNEYSDLFQTNLEAVQLPENERLGLSFGLYVGDGWASSHLALEGLGFRVMGLEIRV